MKEFYLLFKRSTREKMLVKAGTQCRGFDLLCVIHAETWIEAVRLAIAKRVV